MLIAFILKRLLFTSIIQGHMRHKQLHPSNTNYFLSTDAFIFNSFSKPVPV